MIIAEYIKTLDTKEMADVIDEIREGGQEFTDSALCEHCHDIHGGKCHYPNQDRCLTHESEESEMEQFLKLDVKYLTGE